MSKSTKEKVREQMKEKGDQNGALMKDITQDLYVQQQTQKVAERYDRKMKQLQMFHDLEMENAISGGEEEMIIQKPSLWARLTRRFKDVYIVFNHNMPVYCHKKDCPTRREGIRWGIEAITSDLGVAFDYMRTYFKKYGEYPQAFAKMLHIRMDRRKGAGVVVSDVSYSYDTWRNSDAYDDEKKIKRKTLEALK